MIEELVDIKGYEGLYSISNYGSVYSIKRDGSGGSKTGGILKYRLDKNGYALINLYKSGNKRTYKIHRIVAEHFIANPNNKSHVNHIDFIRVNNRVDNLEWCTISENHKHTWANGRGRNPLHTSGLNHPNTLYNKNDILQMLKLRNSGLSYPKIAIIFSCAHSTVIRLVKQYRQLIEQGAA